MLLLFYIFLGLIFPCIGSFCPSGYSSDHGRCYTFISTKRSWDSARSDCRTSYSGDLLSIHTYSLKDIVWSHTERTEHGDLWIGALSGYTWLDGTAIPDYWYLTNEPNSDKEGCVEVWATRNEHHGTGLNDGYCHNEQEYACQADECYSIANCIEGSRCSWQRSYFSSNTCDRCDSGHYSGGLEKGCIVCADVANCVEEICSSATDQTCVKCVNNNVYFKLTNNNKSCDRMCSSDKHYCWPGSCDESLASKCECSTGFRKVSTAEMTLCQPETKPEIYSCDTVFTGPNGEKKRLASNTASLHCKNLQDIYGNFQPTAITFSMTSEYTIDISTLSRPQYIQTEMFGVTDTEVILLKQPSSDPETVITSHQLKTDTTSSREAARTVQNNDVLQVDDSRYNLRNGDAICIQYKGNGGGFFESKNPYNSQIEIVTYHKTEATETKCYKFDDAPPEHCSGRNICQYEPLQIDIYMTRSGIVDVAFKGWSDPAPNRDMLQASGIEHFELRVSEVIPAGDLMKVDTSIYYEELVPTSSTRNVILNLTTSTPKLFSVLLEVKDIADNIRQARRFVLSDSTSNLNIWEDNPFIINSASMETDYSWQTNFEKICLTWTDHFYNDFYLHNPLLSPIEPDPHGLIIDVYEHLEGLISVHGTPNVHGIIQYLVSWRLNEGPITKDIEIENFLHQNFCREFDLHDGQTYTFFISPVDIAQNTLTENRTVHIDASPPHIDGIGLIKDGFKGLSVHDDRDLSQMELYFEALDPHSGIRNVEWWFGTEDTGQNLDSGVLGVERIEGDCEGNASACYCPDVGACENHAYIIPLNKLVSAHKHHGDHNRNYFFQLKVTNIAGISAKEYVTILVDFSPPEVGIIHEGSTDGKDIDYTSEDAIAVHWYGFVDHESGIKMYRIGIANRCLLREELSDYNNITDIMEHVDVGAFESNVRIAVNFTGKMYVTIIAFNNAMDPSDSVCSDGIIRDLDPPKFRNLSVEHLSVMATYVCLNDDIWILNSDFTLYPFPTDNICGIQCSVNSSLMSFMHSLPKEKVLKAETEDVCDKIKKYSKDTIMYLPSDYLRLSWEIDSGSQIDNFYVGIGLDSSESESPQMLAYTPTNGKTHFYHRHEGLSSDEIFYVFVKAVSKSGLEDKITIGPMLVDSTPPLYLRKPNVHVLVDNIMITWEEDTFYDMEQEEQIHWIEYTFGYKGKTISNRLTWNKMTNSSSCSNECCCINYPLEKLQNKDTDLGLEFYATLYVFNNAGHFTEIRTDVFKIPSRYPPGHAIIFDVDPDFMELKDDIDAHFSVDALCAYWTGFKHHEKVQIEVGIGSTDILADVVPFQIYNETIMPMMPFCINSTNIDVNRKYHIVVKAECSGGSTISSSDGVYILQSVETLLSQISVFPGFDCASVSPIAEMHILNVSQSTTQIKFDATFNIGDIFSIFISTDNGSSALVTLDSDDAIILPELTGKEKVSFTTSIESPYFNLKIGEERTYQNVTLNVVRCPSTNVLLMEKHLVSHWTSSIDSNISFVWYEVGIVRNDADNSFISELEREVAKIHKFENIRLHPSVAYKFAVKLCTKQKCLSAVYSDNFYIEEDQPTGIIEIAELDQSINKTCFDIKLTWLSVTTDSEILFYQWSISKDEDAEHIVTSWKTVQPFDENKINECLYVQPYAFSSLFGCVKAYSLAGSRSTTCTAFDVKRSWTSDTYVVYDLNSSAETWNFVLSMVHSSDFSDTIRRTLHDIDIDITPTESTVAGAVMGTSGRNVSWYLMTSKHIPSHCSHNEGCYYSTETDTGYVKFQTNTIMPNTLYHICAHSNETLLHMEDHTLSLDEFSSCSNGFIKDDMPPSNPKGVVRVSSQNGYITDKSRLLIYWDAFDDNINASVFGYPENIRAYSYAIGSSEGRDDIKQFSEVGHSTITVARDVNIRDGFPLYVTVKASDYVDHEGVAFSEEFIVDTTPPVPGRILIEPEMANINTLTFIDNANVVLHLTDFNDDESGLSYFEVGVGSHFLLNNIMSLTKYDSNVVQLELDDGLLTDGRTYFLNVKAVNNAGLPSSFVTKKISVDRSPPTGGYVIDGDSLKQEDDDFSIDTLNVEAQWRGFVDPHSRIHYYQCGFGTKPYMDDIRSFINVGLRKNITWNGPFVSGQTYYTTVEACNHAGQCRSVSSDGVTKDNSPPIPGVVRIGSEDLHHKYYAHTNWLHLHWVGFEDPQSQIDHYEVCVGSVIGECNFMQKFNTGLKTNIIKTELHLPVNTNLYATVTAYNKIGLNASYTSDSFQIDDTPPVVEQIPRFINPFTFHEEPDVQWEKSILKLSWLFKDEESPIINHRISLFTHHEGHTPVDHVYVGSHNNFTLNLAHNEWLHNGDIYYAKVTSCNAAGLCSTSQSADLVIDSTPPHVGGFKQPLRWANYEDILNRTETNLTLTWYGFHDQESPINSFYITVSRSYSGQELTGGVFTFNTENITDEYTIEVPLVENIFQDELLILSIWAENKAGLTSSVARVSVYVLSETTNVDTSLKHGTLEIEKHSCDIHFCNKDCTCAVFGQPCIYSESKLACNATNTSDVNSLGFPTVDVAFGYTFEQGQNVTASSSCLSGTWKSADSLQKAIERYEWSIGLADQPIGEGIFDLKTEQPWNDVGIQEKVTHCLPVNRSLIHAERYILHIRAWYSRAQYTTFTSTPIMIDHSAPAVSRGKVIKDSDVSCNFDYDFIDWIQNITACWSGVFIERQGSITHYTVALGTLPNADDVFPRTDVGLASNITLQSMSFTHGTRYYFTVTAYNTAGLSTNLASDGFLVDTDNPVEGIVYNTIRMQNRQYESKESSISISWNGFTDHFSGIYGYQVAICDTDKEEAFENLTFIPVGLSTLHTFINMNLVQNKTYYGVVKASDAAGHFSNVAVSPGITVDATKPTGTRCTDFRYIQNDTFVFTGLEEETTELMVNTSKNDLIRVSMRADSADIDTKIIIGVGIETAYLSGLRLHDGFTEFNHTFFAQESSETVVTFRVSSKTDSRLNVFIYRCTTFEIDDQNAVSVIQTRLSVLNINTLVTDNESKICSLLLGVGTTPNGFQVQPLKPFHHNTNHAIITANIGHGNPVYVTGIAENCAGLRSVFKAEPIIMDHTAPFLNDIHTSIKVQSFPSSNATLEQYFSIEAAWQTKDYESGVKYCFCATETHPGAQDIKPYWIANSTSSCFSGSIKLTNVLTVILAVKCVNNLELSTLHRTEPQTITLHPPDTELGNVYIMPSNNDNIEMKSDLKNFLQTSKSTIVIGWSGFEDASDISSYEYRLTTNERPVFPWQEVVARDVITLYGLNLETRRTYTAEVKATNTYGFTSAIMSANITVLEETPRLSGQSISISKQGNQMKLDWSQVFSTFEGIPVSYSLDIGTQKGFADVVNMVGVTASTTTVTVPRSTLLTPNPTQLYITITCSFPFGLVELYEKTYTI